MSHIFYLRLISNTHATNMRSLLKPLGWCGCVVRLLQYSRTSVRLQCKCTEIIVRVMKHKPSYRFPAYLWLIQSQMKLDTSQVEVEPSLGPRPKTNPSADRFQYRARYTGSDIRAGWGLGTRLGRIHSPQVSSSSSTPSASVWWSCCTVRERRVS